MAEHQDVQELYRRLDCKLKDTEFKDMEQHYSCIRVSIHAVADEPLGYYRKKKHNRKPFWLKQGGRNTHP